MILIDAVDVYNAIKEYEGYDYNWLPLVSLEDSPMFFVQGNTQKQQTAPILFISRDELGNDADWRPKPCYQSLNDLLLAIAESLEKEFSNYDEILSK